jgi:hypothetical protein
MYVVPRATEVAMEMSSDGGTGAQEKQVTVAYDGGGCKREQRNETMTWAIYNVQTWGTPGREPRPDADHGKDRTGDHHLVNRLVGLTQWSSMPVAFYCARHLSIIASQGSRSEMKGEDWVGWRHNCRYRSGDMAELTL